MSVWYVCPSSRPKAEAEDCLQAWLDFGCRVMILREGEALDLPIYQYPVSFYSGWAVSNNHLIRTAMSIDKQAHWFVCGGDDYWPDTAWGSHFISRECLHHFGGTLGVMQPTGDRYQDGYIDTAAASPWIGREFAQRAYNGHGPFRDDYFHLYADTELQQVALKLGVFWQRPDIKQEHKHWSRGMGTQALSTNNYAFSEERDRTLYEVRLATGFAGYHLASEGAE